jgi:transglutaminase-like putative cysteine protease
MMTDRQAEERIRSWLIATAPRHLPDRVLTDTHQRTRRMAQASSVPTRWSRVTRPLPIVFAAASLAIVLLFAASQGIERLERVEPAALTSTIGQVWSTDGSVAVTIERDPADDRIYYWKAATYDQVDLHAWSSSNSTTVARAPGARLLDGMADDIDGTELEPLVFTVRPESFRAPSVLSPGTPLAVDRAVRVTTVGEGGYLATVDRDGGGAYTVTAVVPGLGRAAPPTESGLRTAGTDYPAEVVDLYTALPAGAFGPNTAALRDDIVRTADSSAPHDIAQRLVEVLQDPTAYTFDADVRDLDCGARSVAECFATYRRGYCQYYATTMAVVLRDLGIPARLVAGFLPGERVPGSAFEVISMSAAHAWVEVYFPGYEWITFDPTGGGVAG